MNNNKQFLNSDKAAFVLGAVLLVTLTQWTGNAIGQGVEVRIIPRAVVGPVVVLQDNYDYYPNYGVYCNTSRHQYAYMRGDAWVTMPEPAGVSAEVLLASPSVKMAGTHSFIQGTCAVL